MKAILPPKATELRQLHDKAGVLLPEQSEGSNAMTMAGRRRNSPGKGVGKNVEGAMDAESSSNKVNTKKCVQCVNRKIPCEQTDNLSPCAACKRYQTDKHKPCTLLTQKRTRTSTLAEAPSKKNRYPPRSNVGATKRNYKRSKDVQNQATVSQLANNGPQISKIESRRNSSLGPLMLDSADICQIPVQTCSQLRSSNNEDQRSIVHLKDKEITCATEHSHPDADYIECSAPLRGGACAKRYFDDAYLAEYCGTYLEEVRIFVQLNGYWLCPTCIYRDERIRASRGPGLAIAARIRSEYGRDRLADNQISEPMNQLESEILGYVVLVRNMPTFPAKEVSFLDIEDFLSAKETGTFATRLLRRLLDVPTGIRMYDKIKQAGLQNLTASYWIRGALAGVCKNMLERTPSPYDDPNHWKTSLVYSFSEEIARIIIQDHHHHQLQDSEFQSRLANETYQWVTELNQTMFPLVGGGIETEAIHRRMSKQVSKIIAILHSFGGAFKTIWPNPGDIFDSELHRCEGLDSSNDVAGRQVKWVLMGGIQYQDPGSTKWRTYSPATVVATTTFTPSALQRNATSTGPSRKRPRALSVESQRRAP
ncbi:hypothetical protein IFR05_008270 [Cadophora sp. M221]|nr:hypothetical protein IFR05_008270 [Cadophora sp. M221]